MTFRGADFLDVANLLFQHSPDEGCEQFSISRAYYATFHSARDYCTSSGVAISQRNAHVEVRWCLENRGQAHVADDLRTLHDLRKNADYDLPFPVLDLSQTTVAALTLAGSILNRLNKLVP